MDVIVPLLRSSSAKRWDFEVYSQPSSSVFWLGVSLVEVLPVNKPRNVFL